jgi:hypothetical protein
MPNIPGAAGVFLPSFLNTCNSAGPSGQTDAYGIVYPSGLTPGKVIMLAPAEAQSLAAPGTTLFDGAYQWILLDSGATAANATAGMAAYVRLDSGPTVGALPETDYAGGNVTTYDQVTNEAAASLFAGVFINPATVNGVAAGPTPGNYTFLFVGAGRVAVNIATATGTTIGNTVSFNGSTNSGFTSNNSNTVDATTLGVAVSVPSVASGCVVWVKNLIYRVFNQGV